MTKLASLFQLFDIKMHRSREMEDSPTLTILPSNNDNTLQPWSTCLIKYTKHRATVAYVVRLHARLSDNHAISGKSETRREKLEADSACKTTLFFSRLGFTV